MKDSLPASGGPTPSGVSRRTLVKGAAWAVPVVTLAGAAPAFAGASQCVPEPVLTDETCKRAGLNQDYKLVFGIVGDDCNSACNLTVTSIRESTGKNVELYPGPPVSQGADIYICNTNNMSAWVEVYGTITCGTEKYQGPETSAYGSFWLVKTPNFQSAGNECTSFTGCGANTTEESTLRSTEDPGPETVQESAAVESPAEAPAAPAETEVVEPVIEAPATEAVAPPAEETVTP